MIAASGFAGCVFGRVGSDGSWMIRSCRTLVNVPLYGHGAERIFASICVHRSLSRTTVSRLLYTLISNWACGSGPRGPSEV